MRKRIILIHLILIKENFKEVMKMNYTSLVDDVNEIHNFSKYWENKMVKNFFIGDLIKAKNVETV